MKLIDYYKRLEAHNWNYIGCHDREEWRKGNFEMAELRRLTSCSSEHKKLFEEFHEHKLSFGHPRRPKPEVPNEV